MNQPLPPPPTSALTIEQLGKYLGKRVQIQQPGHSWSESIGILGGIDARYIQEGEPAYAHVYNELEDSYDHFPIECIKPILRPLKNVAGEEWHEAFQLAFYHTEIAHDVLWHVGMGYVELDYEFDKLKLIITESGVIVASSYRYGHTGPARINILALYDYLDSRGIDCRGMLRKGLAVEEGKA